MDKWEMYMEIHQLLKKGFSKTKVAQKLGVSRSTIYRNLKKSPSDIAKWVDSLQTRRKKLAPYRELILLIFIAFVLANSRFKYMEWLDRTGNSKIHNTPKKDRSTCSPLKDNT